MKKSKKVFINWLNSCQQCGTGYFYIDTLAEDGLLNIDDNVVCHECGQTGYVDVQDGNAFVCWDELSDCEVKYNKLKIMYEKLKDIVISTTGPSDIEYLKKIGVID